MATGIPEMRRLAQASRIGLARARQPPIGTDANDEDNEKLVFTGSPDTFGPPGPLGPPSPSSFGSNRGSNAVR